MDTDAQFMDYLKDVDHDFTGWDFSFITGTGRMQNQLLPWSYGSIAKTAIQQSKIMLDMGTGGGEFLSLLRPLPVQAYATEGYEPNVGIAKKRLEPLGVKVIEFIYDANLPFDNGQFDLILNQHESYSAIELRRISSSGGNIITQQVGGIDCYQINDKLGVPLNKEFQNWCLESALEELEASGFKIVESKEAFPVQRFYDIGALAYYLKAIPWQIPDFSIQAYMNELYKVHCMIKEKGYFDVNQHRFLIKAEAK
ncbi:class I SAM-dependent methyltransferase [Guptibacillus hwajinpoensis]|uniref:SAM-dependent methyltransferase n=1 Tax=Guptibacillus hwajinpoensis TaxID=208199 RepID=A0ABU0K135_9BACL|nr:methyltransferase domain-containing protein [Alkalihalobacillus hemicentroti]MDQ0483061.1 SAM-dependent methyltransferase [Alkalihalobacillus hemicentroti]